VLSTRSASHSGGERFAELVRQINNRVSRHLGASRRALFEELERSALKPLSAEPYVFAEWKECRVGLDYHVEIEKHYHSVPHQLLREKVWARITARTIEVFHRGKRVAAHLALVLQPSPRARRLGTAAGAELVEAGFRLAAFGDERPTYGLPDAVQGPPAAQSASRYGRTRSLSRFEAMLAAQMAAVHVASMSLAQQLANAEMVQHQDSAERAFNRLTRTFSTQMEALKRYRARAEQNVTVQNLSVESGGQAVVGNVAPALAPATPANTAALAPAGTSKLPKLRIVGGPEPMAAPLGPRSTK
jgi:hypothetical protein